jgi:cell division topological specificity factor
MSLLSFFNRPRSAPVARERLQLLLAHERTATHGRPDLLELLRAEILQVIAKHVVVESEEVKVSLDKQEGISTLEIDIEIRTPLNVLSTQEAGTKVA